MRRAGNDLSLASVRRTARLPFAVLTVHGRTAAYRRLASSGQILKCEPTLRSIAVTKLPFFQPLRSSFLPHNIYPQFLGVATIRTFHINSLLSQEAGRMKPDNETEGPR